MKDNFEEKVQGEVRIVIVAGLVALLSLFVMLISAFVGIGVVL